MLREGDGTNRHVRTANQFCENDGKRGMVNLTGVKGCHVCRTRLVKGSQKEKSSPSEKTSEPTRMTYNMVGRTGTGLENTAVYTRESVDEIWSWGGIGRGEQKEKQKRSNPRERALSSKRTSNREKEGRGGELTESSIVAGQRKDKKTHRERRGGEKRVTTVISLRMGQTYSERYRRCHDTP